MLRLLVVVFVAFAGVMAQPPDAADLVLVNGKVFTADARGACYSLRSALEGSTIEARRAGTRLASADTTNNVAIAPPHASGSTKLTP
jgi:hypothetical protein